jgi:3-oxoacyl-[acyl-carrier protein] reductase
MLKIDLTGKVALVTGGAKGIGAGIAETLSRCGAEVCVLDIIEPESAVNDFKQIGIEVNAWKCDATDCDMLCSIAAQIILKFGHIDILVTSAGTTSRFGIDKLRPEEWNRILNINLNGTFNAVHAVVPSMLQAGRGVVIMIGSAAIVAGSGGGVHYAASKSALEGLNRGLTRELAPKGIRTNLVHPSLIDTELLRQRHPDPELRKQLAKTEVPLGRLGTPQDIANITAFLASDLGSYITGQSVFVDGGRTFCK